MTQLVFFLFASFVLTLVGRAIRHEVKSHKERKDKE